MTGRTCALHAGLVQDAVQNVALAILVFLLEDQSRDLDQETGQLSLQQHKPAWSAHYPMLYHSYNWYPCTVIVQIDR